MTEKELHKLRRQEVLQLLLIQVQEAEQLKQQLDETAGRLQEEEELCGRLKARLNEKDEQIQHLKGRLDKKDERIRELQERAERQLMEGEAGNGPAGSIAEAALQISGIFEAAQKAADIYLESIRRQSERKTEGVQ